MDEGTTTRIDALIDEELWPPLVGAIQQAREELLVTQLLFEPRFTPLDAPLADELEAAARRGAQVRLLVNENAAIPDSYDEMQNRFQGTPVEVLRLPMTPNVMHAKLVVVDGREAFLVDAPFEQKYVDRRTHPYLGSHRGRTKPFHSVSARLRGPLAASVHAFARELFATAGAVPPPRAAPAPRPLAPPARLVHTAPPGLLPSGGALEVLEAYERALARAKRLVYFENQYFTSPRIAAAVGAALEREPELEVVLLLNERMDVPSYDLWQRRRLAELDAWGHPRLGVFTLHSPRRTGPRAERAVYIHSKVGIVDDAWATLGSANLDSVSLHESTEFPIPVPPNVELNVEVEGAWAASLRRRLWAEHLDDPDVWRAQPPPGGWLARWRRVAEENERRIAAGDGERAGRVLPFPSPTAKEQRQAISARGPRGA